MPTINNLDRLRCSRGGCIEIDESSISTHNIHFWVPRQPLANTLSLSISKQINNLVRLQVHKDGAEALAASPAPIVNADNAHWPNLRQRD